MFISYTQHMKRAKARAITFQENAYASDDSIEQKATVIKVLNTIILANLFCAIVLYIIYLVF
jgi:hypothetical protein